MRQSGIIFMIVLQWILCSLHAQPTGYERPKVGLVLSGGGAKGLAHIGVLKVLEEAGMPIDYIAGTSMGGIVGGLYSIGYTAEQLDSIARVQDWEYLLTDDIPRRELSIEEKEDEDKYFVSFPIKEKKLKLPPGVISGQHIENLLAELCTPVYRIHDFDMLPIPFRCIGVDIVTGEEVVLKEGNLPDALRATMSIPTIFTPIEFDGHLLIDGGLINNYPADEAKKMGADIIIGIDVTHGSYKKEEMDNFLKVMEQAIFFYSSDKFNKNLNMSDLLIEPDLKSYSMASFFNADSIIFRGEIAARKVYQDIKQLADSISALGSINPLPSIIPEEEDSLLLHDIEIVGLKKVSPQLVMGKLKLADRKKVTASGIREALKRVYASLFFTKVTYELEPLRDGIKLIVRVQERSGGLFRVGLHYDTDYKASLNLNTTFRNLLFDGSKLSLSAGLGEYPRFNFSYFINKGWKPGAAIEYEFNTFDVDLFQEEVRVSKFRYTENSLRLYTRSNIGRFYGIGAGLEFENLIISPNVNPLDFEKTADTYYNLFGFIEIDTYDDYFFPTMGFNLFAEYKYINKNKFVPIHFLYAYLGKAYRLNPHATLITSVYGTGSYGKSIPLPYLAYMGGLNNTYRNGVIPFLGFEFMEKFNQYAVTGAVDLQVNVWRNFYTLLKFNAGNLTSTIPQLFSNHDIHTGYGISIAHNSAIGPIQFTLMKASRKSSVISYINIGYWF